MITHWVLLALFLFATTYLPGRALTALPERWRPPRSALLQSACGLGSSLILCIFPRPLVGGLLAALALAGIVGCWLARHRNGSPLHEGNARHWALAVPGVVLAALALTVGPWGDAWSSEGDLLYRTGARVGTRSAGPSGVLPEVAQIDSRRTRSGDPFVSGLPLPAFDPRRTYLGLSQSFSGLDPFTLHGKVFPTLGILVAISTGVGLLRHTGTLAPILFGGFLFGSGLSWLAGALPLFRSWSFRIWPHLTESTGLPDLLSAGATPLLLFLLLASVSCLRPEEFSSPLWAGALAAVAAVSEPRFLPALAAGALFFGTRARWTRRATIASLTLFAVSLLLLPVSFQPLQPMLRALDYARLGTMRDIVIDALSGGSLENVLRTLLYVPVFIVLSLGIRAAVLPALLRRLSRGATWEAWGASLAMSFLGLGLVIDVPEYWSLGLLLIWLFVAQRLGEVLKKLPTGRGALLLSLAALLAFPSSVNFLLHYHRSLVEMTKASDVNLARRLASRSAPGDPVLHRPNRGRLSLASHIAVRPAVLCYFGRGSGYADEALLEERSSDVRAFFATGDAEQARAIVNEYGLRWVLVEKARPLGFPLPPWLALVDESETYHLYEAQ